MDISDGVHKKPTKSPIYSEKELLLQYIILYSKYVKNHSSVFCCCFRSSGMAYTSGVRSSYLNQMHYEETFPPSMGGPMMVPFSLFP